MAGALTAKTISTSLTTSPRGLGLPVSISDIKRDLEKVDEAKLEPEKLLQLDLDGVVPK